MVNYDWYVKRTTEVPCYRGTPNRFPLMGRRNTRYYFLKDEEAGETVFDVCYDYSWERTKVDKETYEKLKASGKSVYEETSDSYVHYARGYRPLLRARPDGYEFTKEMYAQGDRVFLSNFNAGWFTNDSRRGGVIYKEGEFMLPIYRGLKVNSSMRPLTKFDVMLYQVDRKKSRALTKQYEDFFKVSETMMLAMTDMDVFARMTKEIVLEHTTAFQRGTNDTKEVCKQAALQLMNSSPLDALVLFAVGHDVSYMGWVADSGKVPSWRKDLLNPETIYNQTERRVAKSLYLANPDVFRQKIYVSGEKYPATEWGVNIIVDGVEQTQCGYSA